MVKMIFLCRRRPDVSHERYVTCVLEDHVPLALAHHPTMVGYTVNVVEAGAPGLAEIDAIAELRFASLEDFQQRLYDSDEGRAAVERDVARFLGGADAYATTEHVHKASTTPPPLGVRAPGVKLVCPVRRREGMSHRAFVEHWLDRHVPLALRHHPGLSRYVTNVVDMRLADTAPEWDGIAELHFPSPDALASGMFDSAAGERVMRADMERFIGRTGAYRVAEYVHKRA